MQSSNSSEKSLSLLAAARDIVLQAAIAVDKKFRSGSYSVVAKSDLSPVTEADLLANSILEHGLRALIPEAGWLSEESVDDPTRLTREFLWVVDPIDGTKEFINGVGEFAVSAGFCRNGEAIAGVVALPAESRILYGSPEKGVSMASFRVDPDTEMPLLKMEPFSLPDRKELVGCRVMVSRTEWNRGLFDSMRGDFEFQPAGSIARKLALLAAGQSDLVISLVPKNEWDICGGSALLNSTPGYRVVMLPEFQSRPFNQKKTRSGGLVAGPAPLVDQFEEYYKKKKSFTPPSG